jgi:hypothetical protein
LVEVETAIQVKRCERETYRLKGPDWYLPAGAFLFCTLDV